MGCAKPTSTHWQDLRARPPATVLAQPGVRAAAGGGFELTFLTERYRVDPDAEHIVSLGPEPVAILPEAFQILLLNYLLAPYGGPPLGEPISEKELPGGATFFRGPHALPVQGVVARFGTDPEGFEARGLALGGERMHHGDCALRFHPFLEIPVTYVLWQADEEFGATLTALFDRSISRWFALDSVFIMAGELSRRLADPF